MQADVLDELFGILRHTGPTLTGAGLEKSVKDLPRENEEFEKCQLKAFLHRKLLEPQHGPCKSNLAQQVDELVASGDLEDRAGGCVRPDTVQDAVQRLVASLAFNNVVGGAREAIAGSAELLSQAAIDHHSAASNIAEGGPSVRDASSLRDGEAAEGAQAKKTRRGDWGGGSFDFLGAAGGLSPRVDIEGALVQLEAGLGGSSAGGAIPRTAAVVEALDVLSGADPETFMFGNHWSPFLELAGRALDSNDSAVHSKAVTLHWTMYEKAMGMNAADLFEAVLSHSHRYFAAKVHVVCATFRERRSSAGVENGHVGCAEGMESDFVVVADSELMCAAREARALHGMLRTVHETFQHLREGRVWSMVNSFLSFLVKDMAISDSDVDKNSLHTLVVDNETFGGGGGGCCSKKSNGVAICGAMAANPGISECNTRSRLPAVLTPAHFLAIAGPIEHWLTSWLRALPTEKLIRAVYDSRLVEVMIQRCDLQGRTPVPADSKFRRGFPDAPLGADAFISPSGDTPVSSEIVSPPVVQCHRLSTCGSATGVFSGNGGTSTPLGRALWLPLAELDRALLFQSVSFLGTIATHCRGAPRPCPLPPGSSSAVDGKRESDAPPPDKEGNHDGQRAAGETNVRMIDSGYRRGKTILEALVRCVSRASPECPQPTAECPSSAPPQTGGAPPSRSVQSWALEHIRQLARSTMGAESTPFTADSIEHVLSLLNGRECDVRLIQNETNGGCSNGQNGNGMQSPKLEQDPVVLEALVDIAGVLLSSRGASGMFFVTGPGGKLEASPALLTLVQFTAELARHACVSSREEIIEGGPDGRGKVGRCGPLATINPQKTRACAVDFACAMTPIFSIAPKKRAAAWKALWRFGWTHAMAALVSTLGASCSIPGCPRQQTESGHTNESHASSGTCSSEMCQQKRDLHHRLLLCVAEWAHDLAGVNALRRVGLAEACASRLSRDLAKEFLWHETRDECPESRGLALVARLALSVEGMTGLLCNDGGIADAVNYGLGSLGQVPELAEILQCGTPDVANGLFPAARVKLTRPSGGKDRFVGDSAESYESRAERGSPIGQDAGDLRCLDFVRRLLFSAWSVAGADGGNLTSGSIEQKDWWLRWAVITAVGEGTPDIAAHPRIDEAVHGERDAAVGEDVQLAGLRLAADLANDLTMVVDMEARWSLRSTLAHISEATAKDQATSATADTGIASRIETNASGLRVQDGTCARPAEFSTVETRLSKSTELGPIAEMADGIIDPINLARARLAVSLSWTGGPTEAQHVKLRQLQRAEDTATETCGEDYCTGSVDGSRGKKTAVFQQRPASDGGIFPGNELEDEEWFAGAALCVSRAVASLADVHEDIEAKEAFAMLSEAAARAWPLLTNQELPKEPSQAEESNALDTEQQNDSSQRGDGEQSDRDGIVVGVSAAIESLCFSYARSLDLVSGESRSSFTEGMRLAMVAAETSTSGAMSRGLALPYPKNRWCDWFVVVAFLASRGDAVATTAMLENLVRFPCRAAFVWPMTGRLHAVYIRSRAATASTTTPQREFVGSRQPLPASPTRTTFAKNRGDLSAGAKPVKSDNASVEGLSAPVPAFEKADGVAERTEVVVGAEARRGDPPMLLLAALVEDVVGEELPTLAAALRRAGWAVAPLALRWIHQCMLGVVDWSGVVAYFTLALLRGPDYQVYFVVAVLRCTAIRVVDAVAAGLDISDLISRGDALEGFDLDEAFTFMNELAQRHRDGCLEAIKAYFQREPGSFVK